MSDPLLPVQYAEITGRVGLGVGDTLADPDRDPDVLAPHPSSRAILTPEVTAIKAVLGPGDRRVLALAPIAVEFDATGALVHRGTPGVMVVDLGGDGVNPVRPRNQVAWTVEFDLRFDIEGTGKPTKVNFPKIQLNPVAGGVNSIWDAVPLQTGSGTPIIQGGPGPEGPAGPDGPQGAPGGSDAATAGWVETGPLTKAALDAGYARKVGPVDTVGGCFLLAHRGAGMWMYPEQCEVGAARAIRDGYVPDLDLWPLADGTVVCCHNPTTDATMTISGTIATMSRAQWDTGRIKPIVPGLPTLPAMTWGQALDALATKGLITAEIKADSAIPTIIDEVKRRGLERHVLLQSTNLAVCAQVTAAGIECALISDTVGTTGHTPAAVLAAGARWVIYGSGGTPTQARTQALIAAGLRVIVMAYQVAENAPARYAEVAGWGASGFGVEDPWDVGRRYEGDLREQFDRYPLGRSYAEAAVPARIDTTLPGITFSHTTTAGGEGRWKMVGLGHGPSVLRLRLKHRVGSSLLPTPGPSWALAVFVGTKDAVLPHISGADETSILCVVQHNGGRNIWQRVGTTQTTVSGTTAADPANFPADGSADTREYEYEIEITETTATLRNLTLGVSSTGSHTLGVLQHAFVTIGVRSSGATYRDIRLSR